jgi:hypothetical protein
VKGNSENQSNGSADDMFEEFDDDFDENDPELEALAAELKATAPEYLIDPDFRESLLANLLEMFGDE